MVVIEVKGQRTKVQTLKYFTFLMFFLLTWVGDGFLSVHTRKNSEAYSVLCTYIVYLRFFF